MTVTKVIGSTITQADAIEWAKRLRNGRWDHIDIPERSPNVLTTIRTHLEDPQLAAGLPPGVGDHGIKVYRTDGEDWDFVFGTTFATSLNETHEEFTEMTPNEVDRAVVQWLQTNQQVTCVPGVWITYGLTEKQAREINGQPW